MTTSKKSKDLKFSQIQSQHGNHFYFIFFPFECKKVKLNCFYKLFANTVVLGQSQIVFLNADGVLVPE
jgi:hypothetical protein